MKSTLLLSLMSLWSYAMAVDAPSEEFYIDPTKIHPQALKDVKGIVMITFAELDYYIHFKTPPAKIQGYLRQDGLDSAHLQLSMKNIKPLSGVDYMQMTLRRFPVVNVDGVYFEIVYDLEKNLRTWIQTVDGQYVRTTVGQLVKMSTTWLGDTGTTGIYADIFYLMNKEGRRFYASPEDAATSFLAKDEDGLYKIPFAEKPGNIGSIEIKEIVNGFGKVFTRPGADGELHFLGWVKIFENGRLSIWPIVTSGC